MSKALFILVVLALQNQNTAAGQETTAGSVTCPLGIVAQARGDQSYRAHSLMKQDCVWSDGIYDVTKEGALWPTSTYAWLVFNRTMTPSTIVGQGSGNLNNGPLASLYVMASNDGATGDVVSLVTSCRVARSGGVCFGGNDVVRNETGIPAKLVGREIDLVFATGSSDAGGSIAQPYNIFNIASHATVSLVGGINGGTWANGHLTSAIRGAHYAVNLGDSTTSHSFIDTTNGSFSDGAILLGRGVTQALVLGGLGFGASPYLYGDAANNAVVNLGSGGYLVIKDPAGTTEMSIDRVGKVTINSLNITKPMTPESSSAPCNLGDQSWDEAYVYICVAPNSWKRAALSAW
jgi:hypothetical protein